MPKPTREEYRKLTRQTLLKRFEEECLRPSQERVQARPASLFQEKRALIWDAKAYFRSRYGDLPNHMEALHLFVKARLVERLKDEPMVEAALGPWDNAYSLSRNARVILLPENSWEEPGYSDPQIVCRHEGFAEYAQSLVISAVRKQSSPPPPPPSPPPDDPVEQELKAKVTQAEGDLQCHQAALKAYRDAKVKVAQEQAERERVAKERADQAAREREARERAEREARDRAEREKRAREQTSRQGSGLPQWALILELTPPYTEEQVRIVYRKKSKLTHPDLGGTVKEFREVDSAYDTAMSYCRSLRTSTI